MKGAARVLAALSGLGACARGVAFDTGDGGACVRTVSAGVGVRVDFDTCIACGGDPELACTVTVDGDRVVVEAGGTIDTSRCESGDTCYSAGVDCGSLALPPGTYTLAYGPDEVGFTVPVTDEVCTAEVPSD